MALRFLNAPAAATAIAHCNIRPTTSPAVPPLSINAAARSALICCRAASAVHDPASPSQPAPQTTSYNNLYTSMSPNHLDFWTSSDENIGRPSAHEQEPEQALLLAELRLLANAAADRAEMHSVLAQQRDNWNKLFQHTLTTATLTASVMAGLNGQHPTLSLSVPALVLNAGCALMMSIINQFQPSQLAEEQRTAARLFKKLVNDIDYALHLPADLRQYTPTLLRDSQLRLRALDRAFPMPLTPGGLEKFPTSVVPPILSGRTAVSALKDRIHESQNTNGWTESITRDVKEVATLLHDSDIKTYTTWAQNVVNVNKCLAIAAPTFAILAAALNAASALGLYGSSINLGLGAAMCSVVATFAGSFSHDMQLGMVFEMYRNSAGYYAEVEASIENTLRVPVEQRENGVLFRRRVAYELGREGADEAPLVPTAAKSGGTLF